MDFSKNIIQKLVSSVFILTTLTCVSSFIILNKNNKPSYELRIKFIHNALPILLLDSCPQATKSSCAKRIIAESIESEIKSFSEANNYNFVFNIKSLIWTFVKKNNESSIIIDPTNVEKKIKEIEETLRKILINNLKLHLIKQNKILDYLIRYSLEDRNNHIKNYESSYLKSINKIQINNFILKFSMNEDFVKSDSIIKTNKDKLIENIAKSIQYGIILSFVLTFILFIIFMIIKCFKKIN